MGIQLGLAAALALFYAYLLPLSVTLEDSGELLMVASSFGIAHPPGYPLFGLIAGLFGLLPTGNLALNVHFMSALFGILTLLVLYRIALGLTGSAASAAFGALMAGMAPVVAWYFTVAEVYSHLTLIYLACFWLALERSRAGWLFFFCGLGLSAHWPLFVLAGPALLILWPGVLKTIRVRHAALFLLGLAPYFFIWFRSESGIPYLAAGRLDSLQGFVDFILRRHYQVTDNHAAVALVDEIRFFANSLRILFENFAWIGALFAAAGIARLISAGRAREALALLWVIFGMTSLLRLFLRVKYDVLFAEELEQFHILPLLGMGIAAAVGAQALPDLGRSPRRTAWAVLAGVAAVSLALNLPRHQPGGKDTFARELARFYLEQAPANAVLLAHGDSDLGPLTYVNRVENFRPDVTVWSQTGFLVRPEGVEHLGGYAARLVPLLTQAVRQGRPVTCVRLHPELAAALGAAGLPATCDPITDLAKARHFADRVASGEVRSARWRYYQEALLGPLCLALARAHPDHPILDSTVYCRYYKLRENPPGDGVAAARAAEALWRDAADFQVDERDTIKALVSRYWDGAE